jgi:murein DD-endopeptidase MepM/ murein hydrolase activator NlpD
MTALLHDLQRYSIDFHSVVPFDPGRDQLSAINLTASNTLLTEELVADTEAFSVYVDDERHRRACRYLIGGYGEHRTIYSRSAVFDQEEEPRRLHLGLDIWGEAGTPVMAAIDGSVHSFAFNNQFGDYGATIILEHQWRGYRFYSLYGHLALADLQLQVGQRVAAGAVLAHFGVPEENGWWPPHLHIQLMVDIEGKSGDYPGVCRYADKDRYLANCPDPDLFCRLYQYI